jgi:hypothetical protein
VGEGDLSGFLTSKVELPLYLIDHYLYLSLVASGRMRCSLAQIGFNLEKTLNLLPTTG